MSHALTAQDLFSEIRRMPATERVKFFSLLSTNAFRDDDFSYEQVFGHLAREPLSAAEAAEYLEISLPVLFSTTNHKVLEFAAPIAFALAFEMVNVRTPFTVDQRMSFAIDQSC